MRLSLEKLIPVPLKDRINEYNSWIWNQELVFNSGERISIQAPSGTGKTTLIHFLYGLRKDYEGKIYWSAFNMSAINAEQLSQIRASYVSVIF